MEMSKRNKMLCLKGFVNLSNYLQINVTSKPPEAQCKQPDSNSYPGPYNSHYNVHDNDGIVQTPAKSYVDIDDIFMNMLLIQLQTLLMMMGTTFISTTKQRIISGTLTHLSH